MFCMYLETILFLRKIVTFLGKWDAIVEKVIQRDKHFNMSIHRQKQTSLLIAADYQLHNNNEIKEFLSHAPFLPSAIWNTEKVNPKCIPLFSASAELIRQSTLLRRCHAESKSFPQWHYSLSISPPVSLETLHWFKINPVKTKQHWLYIHTAFLFYVPPLST